MMAIFLYTLFARILLIYVDKKENTAFIQIIFPTYLKKTRFILNCKTKEAKFNCFCLATIPLTRRNPSPSPRGRIN